MFLPKKLPSSQVAQESLAASVFVGAEVFLALALLEASFNFSAGVGIMAAKNSSLSKSPAFKLTAAVPADFDPCDPDHSLSQPQECPPDGSSSIPELRIEESAPLLNHKNYFQIIKLLREIFNFIETINLTTDLGVKNKK